MSRKTSKMIPFSDPDWHTNPSPYYNESHRAFQVKMRTFVDTHIMPYIDMWEDDPLTYKPRDLVKKAVNAGVYEIMLDRKTLQPSTVYDAFHEMIQYDELSRAGSGGLQLLFSIKSMAMPPLLHNARTHGGIFAEAITNVLNGTHFASLAITEPHAGSDVAAVNTSGILSPCGQYYIVNGLKKYITMGFLADYYTTAVKLEGSKDVSMLLIPRALPGISVRKMKLQGNGLAMTSLVLFEDVKVPIGNLVGTKHKGFKALLQNFNHERFVLSVCANRNARVCLSESIQYARTRKTFQSRLIDHQVIRHKIAEMTRLIESTHHLLTHVCYLMTQGIQPSKLAGLAALTKVQASKTYEFCAREASQIFGGNSYVRSGKGVKVERCYREVRAIAIPGGSEEILIDLAMKQAKL